MSGEQLPREPSIILELSRRKGAATREAMRNSLVEARLVAAPYVTMARISLARLGRDRLARAGALLLACLALVAVFADVLASDLPIACRWHGAVYVMPDVTHPAALAGVDVSRMQRERAAGDWMLPPLVEHGPTQEGAPSEALRAPLSSPGHPLGTDALGRDVFARVVYGARTALGLGLVASLALVAIGVILGALAGFVGGVVDSLVSRAVESLTAIPTLVLVLVVGALVPHPTTATLLWTIALTRWTELARLVRAEVLRGLGEDYVTAARALGVSPLRVLWRHVMPNAIGPVIAMSTIALGLFIVTEATLSYLGVGLPPSVVSWGGDINVDQIRLRAGSPILFYPAGALAITVLAFLIMGDVLRDALDPTSRARRP